MFRQQAAALNGLLRDYGWLTDHPTVERERDVTRQLAAFRDRRLQEADQ